MLITFDSNGKNGFVPSSKETKVRLGRQPWQRFAYYRRKIQELSPYSLILQKEKKISMKKIETIIKLSISIQFPRWIVMCLKFSIFSSVIIDARRTNHSATHRYRWATPRSRRKGCAIEASRLQTIRTDQNARGPPWRTREGLEDLVITEADVVQRWCDALWQSIIPS